MVMDPALLPCTAPRLPSTAWEEILQHLRQRDLAQLRLVCRSWCADASRCIPSLAVSYQELCQAHGSSIEQGSAAAAAVTVGADAVVTADHHHHCYYIKRHGQQRSGSGPVLALPSLSGLSLHLHPGSSSSNNNSSSKSSSESRQKQWRDQTKHQHQHQQCQAAGSHDQATRLHEHHLPSPQHQPLLMSVLCRVASRFPALETLTIQGLGCSSMGPASCCCCSSGMQHTSSCTPTPAAAAAAPPGPFALAPLRSLALSGGSSSKFLLGSLAGLGGCSSLRELHLSHCTLSVPLSTSLPGLTRLSLRQCDLEYVTRGLTSDLGDLRCLRHLTLECMDSSSMGGVPLGLSKLTCCHTLELEVHRLSSAMGLWQELGQLTGLARLSVHISSCAPGVRLTLGDAARALPLLFVLKSLDLKGFTLVQESDLQGLGVLCSLESLTLHPAASHSSHPALPEPAIGSSGMLPLVLSLTKLQHLALPQWPMLPQGLAHLKGFNKLQTLDLSEARWLEDGCLTAAAVGWRQLQTLRLSGCRLLSDLGLMVIAASCPGLRELDISRCAPGVSGTGVERLTVLTRLTHLYLTECDRVTSDAVAALAAAALPLEVLDLSGCRLVTDAAVAAIGRSLLQLRQLRLGYCGQVTNLGVRHLLQLPELQELDLLGTLYQRSPGMERLHRRVELVHYDENSGLQWLL